MAWENRARRPSFSSIADPVAGRDLVENVSSTEPGEHFELMPPVWQEGMTAHQNTRLSEIAGDKLGRCNDVASSSRGGPYAVAGARDSLAANAASRRAAVSAPPATRNDS